MPTNFCFNITLKKNWGNDSLKLLLMFNVVHELFVFVPFNPQNFYKFAQSNPFIKFSTKKKKNPFIKCMAILCALTLTLSISIWAAYSFPFFSAKIDKSLI